MSNAPRKIRVGITGFGRMGRLAVRQGWGSDSIEFVHINEIKGGVKTAAHLLEFDSFHGRWNKDIKVEDGAIVIEGKRLTFSEHKTPAEIPWDKYNVDVVLACDGVFKSRAKLTPHFQHKCVKKIVVSAPVKEADVLNVVMGCNDNLYDPAKHDIVTAASCTTNAMAPVIKVLLEKFGIEQACMTTIHNVTNTQVVCDAPHKDPRRARSALKSLVPTTTGSATAITVIYPELKGKINGLAVRVPLTDASLVDLVVQVSKDTTVEEINAALEEASKGSLRGVLGFEPRPLVSVDYANDPRSGTIDAGMTMVTNNNMVKLLIWYDNETGYVQRMVELTEKVASKL